MLLAGQLTPPRVREDENKAGAADSCRCAGRYLSLPYGGITRIRFKGWAGALSAALAGSTPSLLLQLSAL